MKYTIRHQNHGNSDEWHVSATYVHGDSLWVDDQGQLFVHREKCGIVAAFAKGEWASVSEEGETK